jgi:hypothetical protein
VCSKMTSQDIRCDWTWFDCRHVKETYTVLKRRFSIWFSINVLVHCATYSSFEMCNTFVSDVPKLLNKELCKTFSGEGCS